MRRLAQARNPYSRTWLWIPGSRSARPGMTKYFTPTNSLRPLPQPRQHLQSAVTVGGQQPHLGLIIPDRLHGVVADAAVGTAGVEARLGETDLHFLHFGECQRALRTWERLDERRCAENAVAEMTDRQRVIHRWIVTAHGVEIRPQQEGWSALHRHPHLRGGTWLRKRLAVGARDAGAGPCRIAAAAAGRCARRAHLIAPMLAAVILAAVDQKARAGTKREHWGYEGRAPGASSSGSRSYAAWSSAGVSRADGQPFAQPNASAQMWVPVQGGPAFLLGPNFYAVRSYNPSMNYALAICHLGDRILGAPPFIQPFPGSERALTLAEVQEMQTRLTKAGFDTGGTDGRVGNDTMKAIRDYQAKMGLLPADGYGGLKVLARLRQGG